MKYIVRKAFYNFEKEEKYLNDMSAKGLAFTDYSWCRYVFEDAPAGKYIYRLELLENPVTHPESMNYIKFMEESGVEVVSYYMRWVYFRKLAADGPFDIYTDLDSKIVHYTRIKSLFSALWLANVVTFFTNLIVGISEYRTNLLFAGLSLVAAVGLYLFVLKPVNEKLRKLRSEKNIRE
ncbi:MAG TPA: hypothetical protein DDZ89_09235 [Clostridiales bacterium]|nr:hypothetical protein [Clostridiales bacterium]